MTVEQKTFISQPERLGVKPTISQNGNIFEALKIAKPKPLTSEQMSVINALRSPRDKLIAQLLVNGREQGKPVTVKELAAIYIPTLRKRKPIIDDEEEIDSEVMERRVYNNIPRSLRPKFEPVGLFIINNYHTGTKGESSYVLKTREELPSQEELLAQYRTLKDLSKAIDEPSLQAVHSKLYSAKKKDPTIEILYLPDGGDSRKIFLTQADFEKSIKAMKATKKAAKNNTSDTHKKPQNKSSTDSVLDKKPSQFDELHERAMLRTTPEQIREEVSMHITDVILSHFVRNCMKELTKSPRELLENALPTKIKLDSVIKEPVEQFFMNKLIERLLVLWQIVDIKSTKSEHQKRTIGYCLEIKQNGYDIRDIVDSTCSHFSIPNPFTSVEAL